MIGAGKSVDFKEDIFGECKALLHFSFYFLRNGLYKEIVTLDWETNA